jgi:transcriptional antiterminator NusG
MMKKIKLGVDSSLFNDVFVPLRERVRKEEGKWNKYEEICFPGYIFLDTDKPKEFNSSLRYIEGFARVVSFGNTEKRNIVPLSEDEERIIYSLIGVNKKIELTTINVDVNKKIKVISGPLQGFEGKVLKYDLHKHTASVELDLNGIKNKLTVGLDVIVNTNENSGDLTE